MYVLVYFIVLGLQLGLGILTLTLGFGEYL